MDFRTSIASARSHTLAAVAQLDRYDHASPASAPHNHAVLSAASARISPTATRHGADALDAARWERWVSARQIRDTGRALELLDRAWWGLTPRAGGQPDVYGARRTLLEAVSWLDRASYGSRWASAPQVTTWEAPASGSMIA